MAAGARVAGCTEVVVGTGTTEVQFNELGPVAIPLEHHHLRPVVPDWSGQDYVLVDPDVPVSLCTPGDRKTVLAETSVLAAVGIGKIDRALIVEGLMHRETSRIGVMSAEIAAGRSLEGERQYGARATVVDDRRKDARFQAAGDGSRIGGIDQVLRDEGGDNLVLDRICDIGAVTDAGIGILKRIKGHGSKLRVFDLLRVLLQQLNGRPDERGR